MDKLKLAQQIADLRWQTKPANRMKAKVVEAAVTYTLSDTSTSRENFLQATRDLIQYHLNGKPKDGI